MCAKHRSVKSRPFVAGLASLVSLLLVSAAFAQHRFQFNINGLAGFPLGEFNSELNSIGGGLDIDFIYSPRILPIAFGVSGGVMVYGHEKIPQIVQTTNADFDVDVRTYNNIFLCHFFLRAQAPQGEIRPYIGGLIGIKYLFTSTQIDERDWYDEGYVSTVNFDDSAFSYGGEIGVLWRLCRGGKKGGKSGLAGLFLDLRMRYLRGGNAQYLKKGGISRVDGDLVYEVLESRTDLLTTNLGVSIAF